jgi:hypothetical protein
VRDAKRVNKVITDLRSREVVIRIFSIPEEDRLNVLLNDSAFDTSGRDKSQCGWIAGCAHKCLAKNQPSDFSMLTWKSKKLARKAASSMLCEALALSKGSAELLWLSTFLLSIAYSDYEMRLKDRSLCHTRAQRFVLRRDNPAQYDPDSLMVIDAKALYDGIKSEQTFQEDRRAGLEIAVIRDDLAIMDGKVKWLPHNLNAADALTKFEGANTLPMEELLRTGKLCLVDEESQLEAHALMKESNNGVLPRSKI